MDFRWVLLMHSLTVQWILVELSSALYSRIVMNSLKKKLKSNVVKLFCLRISTLENEYRKILYKFSWEIFCKMVNTSINFIVNQRGKFPPSQRMNNFSPLRRIIAVVKNFNCENLISVWKVMDLRPLWKVNEGIKN